MYTSIRNNNQRSVVINDLIEKTLVNFDEIKPKVSDNNLPVIERENVKILIEKRVKMVGKFLPFDETIIKKRLLSFIKKNRVAMRYEQACCRHIKQFSAAAFLFCEICENSHDSILWDRCTVCGAFNNYKI